VCDPYLSVSEVSFLRRGAIQISLYLSTFKICRRYDMTKSRHSQCLCGLWCNFANSAKRRSQLRRLNLHAILDQSVTAVNDVVSACFQVDWRAGGALMYEIFSCRRRHLPQTAVIVTSAVYRSSIIIYSWALPFSIAAGLVFHPITINNSYVSLTGVLLCVDMLRFMQIYYWSLYPPW